MSNVARYDMTEREAFVMRRFRHYFFNPHEGVGLDASGEPTVSILRDAKWFLEGRGLRGALEYRQCLALFGGGRERCATGHFGRSILVVTSRGPGSSGAASFPGTWRIYLPEAVQIKCYAFGNQTAVYSQ
jgi:hypothetical protein